MVGVEPTSWPLRSVATDRQRTDTSPRWTTQELDLANTPLSEGRVQPAHPLSIGAEGESCTLMLIRRQILSLLWLLFHHSGMLVERGHSNRDIGVQLLDCRSEGSHYRCYILNAFRRFIGFHLMTLLLAFKSRSTGVSASPKAGASSLRGLLTQRRFLSSQSASQICTDVPLGAPGWV